MSLIKSATRRLSLLAGSSLAIASVVSISSALTVLTPTSAYAYDECAPVAGTGTQSDGVGGQHDATINGNAPDTFRCTTIRPSVVYNSLGTTGLLTIEFVSSNPAIGFSTAAGVNNGSLQTLPGGDAVVNLGPNTVLRGGSGATTIGLDATVGAGTTTTINLADNTVGLDLERNAYIQGTRAVGAGALVINNDGVLQGIVNLSGLTGAHTLNITSNGSWYSGWLEADPGGGSTIATTTVLAQGNDTVTVSEGGIVYAGTSGATAHLMDFREAADDLDVFSNAGHVAINPGLQDTSLIPQSVGRFGTVTMSGLEEFHNSGTIMLGSVQRTTSAEDTTPADLVSDGWYDDVLSLPGTTWVSDGGEVVMNVDLVRSQSDCTTRGTAGALQAADCLMIVGGETQGLTYLTLNETIPGDRGRHNPEGILLVDVSDGTSAQGHFVVGPNSANYSPEFGGSLDKGIFFYAIAYNEDTQQHILYGLPGANAQQFPLLASAGQSLWRTSTGTWFERQADLRGDQDGGVGGGVWLRVNGEKAERDVINEVSGGGQTFAIDNSLAQTSYAATVGADLVVGGGADSAYVLGVMAGYVNSEVKYQVSPNEAQFDGWTAGAYASFIAGGFFVDAALNMNRLIMDNDVPALALFPAGTILSTDLFSIGVQAEAGMRFPLTGGLFIEPLAGLSYVQSKFEEIDVPADDPARPRILVEYDDPASFRGSVGARGGWDLDNGAFRTQLSLLGRLVEEFDGANNATILNEGPDALLTDDFSGRYTEVSLGANIYSPGGAVSGFLNFGGRFGEDYRANTASAGVRITF